MVPAIALALVAMTALAGCGDSEDAACRGYARSDLLWDVAYGKAGFVGVGNSGAVATSTDGVVRERRQAPAGGTLRGITYGRDRSVAVGAAQTILVNTNGRDWTTCSDPGPSMPGASRRVRPALSRWAVSV